MHYSCERGLLRSVAAGLKLALGNSARTKAVQHVAERWQTEVLLVEGQLGQ